MAAVQLGAALGFLDKVLQADRLARATGKQTHPAQAVAVLLPQQRRALPLGLAATIRAALVQRLASLAQLITSLAAAAPVRTMMWSAEMAASAAVAVAHLPRLRAALVAVRLSTLAQTGQVVLHLLAALVEQILVAVAVAAQAVALERAALVVPASSFCDQPHRLPQQQGRQR